MGFSLGLRSGERGGQPINFSQHIEVEAKDVRVLD